MARKGYKSYELYCCFTLNRLIQELDINLRQEDLEERLEGILTGQEGVTKGEIKYEIKSNNFMTNKVLDKLLGEELIEVEKTSDRYNIRITKKGVLHVRRFNEFYWQMFRDHIVQHYQYKKLPSWFESM